MELITARQLALKTGLTTNNILKKLNAAGIKVTKKNTRSNIDFGIATRDAQNYYNIHEALNALQPKELKL